MRGRAGAARHLARDRKRKVTVEALRHLVPYLAARARPAPRSARARGGGSEALARVGWSALGREKSAGRGGEDAHL